MFNKENKLILAPNSSTMAGERWICWPVGGMYAYHRMSNGTEQKTPNDHLNK